MILYKYCPTCRVPVLRERRIYFTKPAAFSDPFELRPRFEHVYDPAVFDKVEGIEWFGKLLEEASKGEAERQWDKAVNSIVVLSLSSRPDSLLMWSHYAEGNKGFVIGIDSEHASVTQGQFRHIAQVRYVHDRPTRRLYQQIVNDELMLTKSIEWHYEAEWRMLDSLFEADGDPLEGKPDSWPFRFQPGTIREIVVGCRGDQKLVQELKDALNWGDCEHVKLLRATIDDMKYRVNIVPLAGTTALGPEWMEEEGNEDEEDIS